MPKGMTLPERVVWGVMWRLYFLGCRWWFAGHRTAAVHIWWVKERLARLDNRRIEREWRR
jgi:hypothetical protein